jgi:hypothetical protein
MDAGRGKGKPRMSPFWIFVKVKLQPRGLENELSSPSRTLGSWCRIPLEVWLSVCVYYVFVLSYV